MNINDKAAILVIDVQNDFCPGGALPVPEGNKVVDTLNRYIEIFSGKKLPIFASRDWHPDRTRHFKDFGGVWPKHCIQHTKGAEFHPDIRLPNDVVIISKGIDPEEDSYSIFDGYDERGVKFIDLLKRAEIKELYIGGLAADYCVKFSTMDALKAHFKVNLLIDAIKGVDVKHGDSKQAIKEMIANGAEEITIDKMK